MDNVRCNTEGRPSHVEVDPVHVSVQPAVGIQLAGQEYDSVEVSEDSLEVCPGKRER